MPLVEIEKMDDQDNFWRRRERVKSSSFHVLYLRIQLNKEVQISRRQFNHTSLDLKGSARSCKWGSHKHRRLSRSSCISPLRHGLDRNESLALQCSNV